MEEIEGLVSVNALASLTIFCSCLSKNNITEIEAPCFLPIRYSSKELLGIYKGFGEEYAEKIDRDQYNMSERFLYTLNRYSYHFNDSFEFDESKEIASIKTKANKQFSDNEIYNLKKQIDGKINHQSAHKIR